MPFNFLWGTQVNEGAAEGCRQLVPYVHMYVCVLVCMHVCMCVYVSV